MYKYKYYTDIKMFSSLKRSNSRKSTLRRSNSTLKRSNSTLRRSETMDSLPTLMDSESDFIDDVIKSKKEFILGNNVLNRFDKTKIKLDIKKDVESDDSSCGFSSSSYS